MTSRRAARDRRWSIRKPSGGATCLCLPRDEGRRFLSWVYSRDWHFDAGSVVQGGPSGSFPLEEAPALLFAETSKLRSVGNGCGLADGRRSQGFSEQFGESFDDDFSIDRLTSALLRGDPKQAFLVHVTYNI